MPQASAPLVWRGGGPCWRRGLPSSRQREACVLYWMILGILVAVWFMHEAVVSFFIWMTSSYGTLTGRGLVSIVCAHCLALIGLGAGGRWKSPGGLPAYGTRTLSTYIFLHLPIMEFSWAPEWFPFSVVLRVVAAQGLQGWERLGTQRH